MMNWRFVTSAEYAAGTKVETDIYFLSDTHEIYRGSDPFTQAVIMYTSLPTTSIATNRLYVNSDTLEGKIHNGTSWSTVIKPVDSTVTVDGTNPVSSAAVIAYVATKLDGITASSDVVSELSWDGNNQVLTITKGDDSTETITFDGLGVSLSYNTTSGLLQLTDASGDVIGDGVSLDLERFVYSGEYDTETQSIILYFDEAKTESVTIPVGDLVDTYTAEALDNSMSLTVESNVIKGKVKISTASGNIITVEEDGIYVAATDISGKMDKDTDATTGNIAVFDDSGNAIDSGKNFDDISSSNHVYIGTDFDTIVTGITPVKDDVVVVRVQIGETDKYQRNCWIYDGEAWIQMDENYNAENIYFASDLVTTTAVGNITLSNGQATIAAAGKSLKQVWDSIFIQETNPTITQPVASISAPNNKSYEVGTVVTPTYTASLTTGTYEFNGSAGITADSWAVTDTDGHSLTTNSGSFDSFTVEDDTNYNITATATYSASTITPVTNVGNDYTDGIIAAGSKSASSAYIKGYRNAFYGTSTSKENDVDAAIIRALTAKSSPAAGNTFTITIPVGTVRIMFAYPATISDVSSVTDTNGMGAEVKTGFTATTIDVPGANDYTAISYKLYVMEYAEACTVANTYKVTI